MAESVRVSRADQAVRPAPPERPAGHRRRFRRTGGGFNRITPLEKTVRYVLLLFVLVITVGPFLWQLSTSLKSINEDVYTQTPSFIPQEPTLANYAEVAETIPIWAYAGNSLIVAAMVVTGNVVGATLAGYALAKLRFRGAKLVLGVFLASLVLPAEVTIISQFVIVRDLGFVNTLVGVALPTVIAPLNVLLMRAAFQSIPPDIDSAAIIDGANAWQRLIHIGLPNVRGMLSVIMIFSFIGAWDDFLWPLLVLTDPDKFTLTVGLQYLNGTFSSNPRLIAAGSMIAFIPILIVFGVLQRFFFRGVDAGAIKG